MLDIPADAQWSQKGVIVAGHVTNQLFLPYGLFIDDDNQMIVIADHDNNCIMQWKIDDPNGKVVVGGKGQGDQLDQLNGPTDVLIDKETDSLIISDSKNRRIVWWSCRNRTAQGEILIDNIACHGLAIDDQRHLYVSDVKKHEVRRYQLGGNMKNGTLVAGGNGYGSDLNQLDFPTYIFVDRRQSVYVSDFHNHRVMKWNKDAKEGIIIAGGQGEGNALTQISDPSGLFVDASGTLYAADLRYNRITRWPQGAEQGNVIVGEGAELIWPMGVSFDRHGNHYVVDTGNVRVLRFSIQ